MKYKTSRKRLRKISRETTELSLPADYGWKVLDKIVEDLSHLLTDNEKSRMRSIIRSRDYEAYLALSEAWGTQSTYLMDKSLAEVRALYQVTTLLKKYRFPSESATRRTTATSKFIEAEVACGDFNREGYQHLAWIEDDRMLNAYSYAMAFLGKLLGHELPSRSKLTLWSRHGPGANLDTKRGHVSTYFKYSEWPYSCTSGAALEARLAIEDDERWRGALEDSYRDRMNIPKTAIIDQDTFFADVLNVVPGNRIAFVPKNSQTDRSIAIEPSMNLYLQLGVDGFIRRRLKRWGVDLDCQEKNRELARLGSRDWESPENFVTLDLAAASDSISTRLCKMLLPREWYNHLMDLRSPIGELGDEIISYEKISSMGNGFTFALESAIFTAIIYGVMREFSGGYDPEQCAIYGDDLIVKNSIAPQVVTLLNLCGFKVNDEKSFFKGPFRESCGADWFKGAPVRPVFLTSLPSSVMELWTDLNRLRRILSLRFMEEESKTEDLLSRWIPVKLADVYGPASDESFDSYRHTSDPRGSYEGYLWKYERLVVIPKPVRGDSFLFRKLMHNLRGQEDYRPYTSRSNMWRGSKVESGGSRFTITKPGSVIVSLTHSVASHWQSEYAEQLPANSRCTCLRCINYKP